MMDELRKSPNPAESESHENMKASPRVDNKDVTEAAQAKALNDKGVDRQQQSLAEELERLKQELQHAKDQRLRTLAEVENTKKRLSREKEEFNKYAAELLVRELLPIVDSLDQAIVAVDKQSDAQAIIKGVHLIYRQFLGLLEKEGVKRIPTIGKRFDPHQHEAVSQVETTDGKTDNTIVEELQAGYTMHGKVIRPAMVKIAKKTTDHRPQTTEIKADTTEQKEKDLGGSNG